MYSNPDLQQLRYALFFVLFVLLQEQSTVAAFFFTVLLLVSLQFIFRSDTCRTRKPEAHDSTVEPPQNCGNGCCMKGSCLECPDELLCREVSRHLSVTKKSNTLCPAAEMLLGVAKCR